MDSFEETETKAKQKSKKNAVGKKKWRSLCLKKVLIKPTQLSVVSPCRHESNCKRVLLQTDVVSGTQTHIPTCNSFPTHTHTYTHRPEVKANPDWEPAGFYPHPKFPNIDDFHNKAAC